MGEAWALKVLRMDARFRVNDKGFFANALNTVLLILIAISGTWIAISAIPFPFVL